MEIKKIKNSVLSLEKWGKWHNIYAIYNIYYAICLQKKKIVVRLLVKN